MRFFKLRLLRFGEGGDGTGSAASEGTTSGETSGEEIPASIPERGRKLYAEVMKQKSASVAEPKETVQADEEAKTSKPTYDELIKSDDYKDAHRDYIEKVINDRLKKYKGQEKSLKEASDLLNTIGIKYGLNPEDKDYKAKLAEAIANDDSYYEKYAEDHDMTPSEARRIVSLERRVKQAEEDRARAEAEEAQRAQFEVIRRNAAITQQRYPAFDLATALNDRAFVQILSATNGDTTAAYIATHHDEIIRGVAASAAQQAQIATANTIASGTRRPIESGTAAAQPVSISPNYNAMNLDQIRAFAEEQRRLQRQRK